MEQERKKLIGRAERVDFPELELYKVPARVDTGAKTSALWATNIIVQDGILTATLFGKDSEFYSGQPVTFETFETTVVSTSSGEIQERYKIRLLVKIKGKKIRAWFTLADRSTQVYPVLIGRNVLLGKFVVDVKHGHTLKEVEQKRTESLRAKLDEEAK